MFVVKLLISYQHIKESDLCMVMTRTYELITYLKHYSNIYIFLDGVIYLNPEFVHS
jgi:hypothetical protein